MTCIPVTGRQLFDVTQTCHPSQDPVVRTLGGFHDNGCDEGLVCSDWFLVDRALVQLGVLADVSSIIKKKIGHGTI